MAMYKIELSNEDAKWVETLAKQIGIRPEELLSRGIAEWLRQPKRDFTSAADYVIQKNNELYDRLS